jgi:putative ABC transport system ATP-binding protein
MIELEHVGKEYAGTRHVTALHDVTLTIPKGEIVAIIGPSGSGTSTLLHLLSMVQLGARISHRPDELSGGERQRVAIARALAVNPPIILADEPTGNLDPRTGTDILGVLSDLHAQLGTTLVVVTHDLRVAERCGRTVTMRDGHIVGDVRR